MKIPFLKEDFIVARRNSFIILKTFKVLKNCNDQDVNSKLFELNPSLDRAQRNYFDLSFKLMSRSEFFRWKLDHQFDEVTSDLIKKLLEEQDFILDRLSILVEKTKCIENLRTEMRLLVYNIR